MRCDSRMIWSLALSTFAAWRGIAASRVVDSTWGSSPLALCTNLIGCGLAFVALALAMRRLDRKAHFEPLTSFLGALALLAGVGLFALDAGGPWIVWALVFLGVAVSRIRRPERRSQELVETCATYWHTVDFLWVLIFALLYVMR